MGTDITLSAQDMSVLREREAQSEGGYIIEAHGLYTTREIDESEWRNIGIEILRRRESIQWSLGDWIVAGQRYFISNLIEEARKITGYDPRTLYNFHQIAKAFPRDERKQYVGLRFSHFKVVMTLNSHRDRCLMLDLAVAERLSYKELDDRVRALFPPVITPLNPRKQKRAATIRSHVKCPECHHIFPIRGHRVWK